jgi:predicted enzyme related to lactoylglutathione lyase
LSVDCAKVLRVNAARSNGKEAEMGERTSYQEGVPSWVDLMTSDPEGARAFYGGLFGWEFDISSDENTGNYAMAQVRGKRVAGMSGESTPAGTPTVWTTYFATDDVDKAVARIREHGGTVMMEPMSVLDSGRLAIAADPAGAVFGLWQAGTHSGAELVNEPGAVIWNELATRDLATAADFYAGVLGLTWESADTGAGGPAYRTMHVGGAMAGGALQMDDSWGPELPAHWTVYFGVQDTDAAVARVSELGGTVQVPPTDSPHGRFAVVSDPHGGVFTVISTEAAEA